VSPKETRRVRLKRFYESFAQFLGALLVQFVELVNYTRCNRVQTRSNRRTLALSRGVLSR
jgi:hypothetical protein